MAALDLLDTYLGSLPSKDRQAVARMTAGRQADIFAARSEEARLRIVNECIEEIRAHLRSAKR
jgi:hypothetical protein